MQTANKGSSDVSSAIIRMGAANMKEEGLRSFLWSKRWLVLSVSELQIFKNEVGYTLGPVLTPSNRPPLLLCAN